MSRDTAPKNTDLETMLILHPIERKFPSFFFFSEKSVSSTGLPYRNIQKPILAILDAFSPSLACMAVFNFYVPLFYAIKSGYSPLA